MLLSLLNNDSRLKRVRDDKYFFFTLKFFKQYQNSISEIGQR